MRDSIMVRWWLGVGVEEDFDDGLDEGVDWGSVSNRVRVLSSILRKGFDEGFE